MIAVFIFSFGSLTVDDIDLWLSTEECGVLESVKAASDLYTPVSGKVTEVNSAIEDRPELLNISCYDEGIVLYMTTY